ncbi:MAG TPA: tetraacyldisaccharide 4'-kinase [Caulobacteraceae bacterium]|jgi:tetraacyldisaccharide 4'-kinase
MKLTTPRWWYVRDRAPGAVLRLGLRPMSWIWAAATARRIAKATPFDAGVPVISVGNLTVGGSGKTPVVREVLARLRAKGVNAAGLSRGYGGKTEGPHAVAPATDTAADVGDEALMLARNGAFYVSRDRAAGARAMVEAGFKSIVLDDGHQNPALKKTLSLIVVDGETRDNAWPFGDGAVFPAGPMREPFNLGLGRADAVVLLLPADLGAPDPDLLMLFQNKPLLIARLEPAEPPPPGPQVGFAGIAKPWKVEHALKAAGCTLSDFVPFPDHQAYTDADMTFIAGRAKAYGAGMVTTEKDWVRLSPRWREQVKAWPVRARFEDEAALDGLLKL